MENSKKFKMPAGYRGLEQERVGVEKTGWYMHYVPSGDNTPFGANAHTHGWPENFNHPDIQICIPASMQIMHTIFWDIFNDFIKKGIKLEPGKSYSNIIRNYEMRSVEAKECGRTVIRLCAPDKHGEYTGEFAKQLTWLDNNKKENE